MKTHSKGPQLVCLKFFLGLVLSSSLVVSAQEQAAFTLGLDGPAIVNEFMLPIGKSQIIQSGEALTQIVVGNPNVADVQLLNQNQFLVLGTGPGTTNLAFRDTQSRIIAVLDVVVGFDLEAIKRKLNDVLPDEGGIEVRSSNGKIMLTGQVSNTGVLGTVLAIAGSYADAEQIMNLVQVGGGQQVLLEARIAEVNRSSLRDLGVQTEFSDTAGSETSLQLLTGGQLQNAFGGVVLNDTSLGDSLLLNLQALERRGAAQILSEPNIVALSGQEASFLVGGEFPVPVAQTGAQAGGITMQYKEYGVGLRFTPTVLSSERINLRLNTEVSDIDLASGTSVLGTTVPGIRTRRTATTIELGDGKSFAIAGLLQNDISSVVKEFPWLGRIPVIGALFRSTEFANRETELVIIVTPRLVKSANRDDISLPTDNFRVPNRWDQYGLGLTEGRGDEAAGGLDGAQGHQF